MDITIVEWFQSMQNSVLDAFFRLVTELGGDLAFLAIGTVLFWLYDKRFGYRFMTIFLFTLSVNDILKNVIRRPRPFAEGADSIGEETYGFAMPSGHSSNVGIMAFLLNERFGTLKKWVTPTLFGIAFLVMISRIYLGQHYLTDVIAGFALAAAVYYAIRFIGLRISLGQTTMVGIGLGFLLVFMVVFAVFYQTWDIPADSFRNLYIAFGSILGLSVGHKIELKYVGYEERAPWRIQALKYIIGLAVALLIQEGLKVALPYGGAGELMTVALDGLRYFFLTLWLSLGALASFKALFSKHSG